MHSAIAELPISAIPAGSPKSVGGIRDVSVLEHKNMMIRPTLATASHLKRRAARLAFFAIAVVALTACGGDDDDDTGPMDASVMGRGGSGATQRAGAAGTTEPLCNQTKTCGEMTCSPADIDAFPLATIAEKTGANSCIEPCCLADDKCGSSLKLTAYMPTLGTVVMSGPNCLEQNQPGTQSAACPKFFELFFTGVEDAGAYYEVDAGSFSAQSMGELNALDFPGCCRFDGYCGFYVPELGLNCASSADIKSMFSFIGIKNLPPKACVP